MSVRDILKSKAAVLGGGSSEQRVFFRKFLGVRPEQAHDRTCQLYSLAAVCVLAVFHAVHTPAQQVIGNSLALIDKNLYQCRLLACVFKYYRVFGIGKDIGAVRRAFLHIVTAKRQVGSKEGVIAARLIRVNGNHFQEAACRDHAAIRRRQVSGSIQPKGNVFVFFIHAKAEKLVCFQSFEQPHRHFLALVIEADSGLGNLHGLARIGKLRIFRLGI